MVVKLLVTGTQGQVARALSERAATLADVEAICVGRPQLDLEQPDTIKQIIGSVNPDIVISAAAYTAVDRAEDEPDIAMRVNADAPAVLASAARKSGAKFIHLSTDYVYDGTKPSPYVETDPVAPQSAYGRSKLAGELQVRDEHPDAMLLRTAWVYSPFGGNFVKTMLELARTRDSLRVVDDQHGNPTSAHDIADAILTIAQRWRTEPTTGTGECYHCAGFGQATWRTLAQAIFETSRANGGPFASVTAIGTDDWPTKAVRPANSQLDCTKLSNDFSWRAASWRTSVSEVVQRLLVTETHTENES